MIATERVWLNQLTGYHPSPLPQKLGNQNDTNLK